METYDQETRRLWDDHPGYDDPADRATDKRQAACAHKQSVATPSGHGSYCRDCGETLS